MKSEIESLPCITSLDTFYLDTKKKFRDQDILILGNVQKLQYTILLIHDSPSDWRPLDVFAVTNSIESAMEIVDELASMEELKS